MADDIFECAQFTDRSYPDGIAEWPEMVRAAAHAARDRLLKREGLSMISERSYCIDRSSDRWPDDVRADCTHALIYEVKLSEPIEA